jgi:hypothetical protein
VSPNTETYTPEATASRLVALQIWSVRGSIT